MKPVVILAGSGLLLAIFGWGGYQIYQYSQALNTYTACNAGQLLGPCVAILGPSTRTHVTEAVEIQTWLKCEKFGQKDIAVVSHKNGKIKEIVNVSLADGKKYLKAEYNYDFE